MRYLLGALLFTTALFSAESRFSEAEAKFNREYDAAKAVFDKAVKVARDKLIVAYNAEMKRLTTTGDLDGAVALRDKIISLEKEVVKKAEPELKSIKLMWPPSGIVVLQPNGVSASTWGGGTWVKENDNYIVIFGGNRHAHTVKLNSQKMTFNSVRGDGDRVFGTFTFE
jgi:hypothetical protein